MSVKFIIDAVDITQDSTHRFVTDADKTKWNSTTGTGTSGYSGFSGKAGTATSGFSGYSGQKGEKGDPGLPGTGGTGGTNIFSIKSIKDFGADPGLADNSSQIQAGIDYCLANNIRKLYIPVGRFKVAKSLIVFRPNAFSTLEIVGESSFWDSNMGSIINYTGTQGFALGIQNGKGCKVKGIRFEGLFTPPFYSGAQFFACKFEDFKDNITRDSQYSPHAAIVIDPFTNMPGQIPADGGYPELTKYYGVSPNFSTSTGSTGTDIEECMISNFVTGIISSPNGFTRNAEITYISKIQFTNVKLAIAGCQDQEKGNRIRNISCWGGTHTIFATALYGSGRMAGHYDIDGANLAGAVNRFIYNVSFGYFPTNIKNIFAESLGEWGTFSSELACSAEGCHIDFANVWEGNDINKNVITAQGENVVFRTCNFRFYDGDYTHKYNVVGNAKFENCYFTGTLVRK